MPRMQHYSPILARKSPFGTAVMPSRERLDLYGYVSMAVGTLQMQQEELDSRRGELRALKKQCRATPETRAAK